MTDAERQELYTLMGQWGRKPEILYQKVREWIEDKKAPEWVADADNLICCARCNEMKECLSIAAGFAGEHEPLCADCISTERLEAESGDVIGK